MSTLKIEERITVSAPPDRVWKFLLDPARVAGCLPGAKLDGTEGDRTFLGTMKVKVGPVAMEFKGKATLSEIVESEHRVTMTGTGNDKSGGGSAKMDMKSHIVALDGGGSEIVVAADVDLAGKLVRFGRGMMEGISKQLFKQFSERVRAELANEEEESAEETESEGEAPAEETKAEEPPPAPKSEEAPKAAPIEVSPSEEAAPIAKEPPAEPAKEPPPEAEKETSAEPAKDAPAPEQEVEKREEPAKASPAEDAPAEKEAVEKDEAAAATKDEPTAEPVAKQPAPAPKKKKAKKKPAPLAKPKEDEALDAGSLVWAALWAWIKGLFQRLFGKRG